MANLNTSFQNFCEKVRLSKSKKENLITSREANRDRIKKYFKETLEQKSPEFFQQGSFSFKTTVEPLNGEFDVDDGVYLQNLADDFLTVVKPETAQNWIAEAVKDATKAKIVYKPSCIRVVYANDYHLDLPVYGIKDGVTYLAHTKSNAWIENDLKGFNDWFYSKLNNASEQLRRNIIYLKAWADYNTHDKITGILITVLVCNNHVSKENRDDLSIFETLKQIITSLILNRAVYMPVAPNDNLLSKYSSAEIDDIINSFEKLKITSEKAMNEKDLDKASDLLIGVLGDRFVLTDSVQKDERSIVFPVGITQPKPWCHT